jgi:hypothetical protein
VGDGLIVKSKSKTDKKLKILNVKISKEKFTPGGEMIIKFSDDCLSGLINQITNKTFKIYITTKK